MKSLLLLLSVSCSRHDSKSVTCSSFKHQHPNPSIRIMAVHLPGKSTQRKGKEKGIDLQRSVLLVAVSDTMPVCICMFFCGLVECPAPEKHRKFKGNPACPDGHSHRDAQSCCSFSSAVVRFFQMFSASPLAYEKFDQRYKLGRELGRGSSGTTRLCIDKFTGEKLACKTIIKDKQNRDPYHEVRIMKQLSCHPGIVNLKADYCNEKSVHLLLELCQGGSLLNRIRSSITYSEPEAALLCKNLMEAVQFCHSRGIIHRDISLANILICDHPSLIKLADFGLATDWKPGDDRLAKIVGTNYFLAPEVIRRDYSKEIDVWSSGVVLYTILSGGEPPFFGRTLRSTFAAILYKPLNFHSAAWRKASPSVKNLITGMLYRDPAKRMTPEQVLKHEWIIQHTSLRLHPSAQIVIPAPMAQENYSTETFPSSSSMQRCSGSFIQRYYSSFSNSALCDLLVTLKLLLEVLFLQAKYG